MLRYFITSKAKRNLLKLFFFNRNTSFYTREIARLTGEPLNAVRRELGYLEKAGLLKSHMQGNLKYYEIIKAFPFLSEWEKIILGTPDTTTGKKVVKKPKAAPKPPVPPPVVVAASREETRQPSGEEPIVPGARVIMRQTIPPEPPEAAEVPLTAPPSIPVYDEAIRQPSLVSMSDLVEYLRQQFINVSTIHLALIHGDSARQEQIPLSGVELLVIGDIGRDSLLALIAEIEEETSVRINLTSMSRSDFDYRNARGDPLVRRIWSEKKLVVKGRH
ncbi:MAG: winged helix-turn-helix domain-containing protein [Dehalococcoidia bacterium]|nr:winged helix-turn-helix domain-containing protein [Dehalococcoidia bacterium]MDD5495321.1 winged helix-turn-helix domain-containing protein [Dehalococcoidia bacterium]